ncbi:hypothetical protein L484_016798 [Morus notabilis]|uniref:Uncharacterized protein n=1 Tax=Morus notabilis TaxID=981085 RepID=W9S4H3_9ROSA|nr:hypothetical protein L484_016798 [Morus notabilis]
MGAVWRKRDYDVPEEEKATVRKEERAAVRKDKRAVRCLWPKSEVGVGGAALNAGAGGLGEGRRSEVSGADRTWSGRRGFGWRMFLKKKREKGKRKIRGLGFFILFSFIFNNNI